MTGLPNFSKKKNAENKWSLRKDLSDPRRNKDKDGLDQKKYKDVRPPTDASRVSNSNFTQLLSLVFCYFISSTCSLCSITLHCWCLLTFKFRICCLCVCDIFWSGFVFLISALCDFSTNCRLNRDNKSSVLKSLKFLSFSVFVFSIPLFLYFLCVDIEFKLYPLLITCLVFTIS